VVDGLSESCTLSWLSCFPPYSLKVAFSEKSPPPQIVSCDVSRPLWVRFITIGGLGSGSVLGDKEFPARLCGHLSAFGRRRVSARDLFRYIVLLIPRPFSFSLDPLALKLIISPSIWDGSLH
jgi:hypothetical protein